MPRCLPRRRRKTGGRRAAQHLRQLPERSHPQHQRFRLAIDRAFTVKGAGLVVTGTALSGEVNVGDTLWLTGVDKPMRVRGLHAQTSRSSGRGPVSALR
jgi:selenocysteine-specific translation elongation factor